MLVLDTDLLTLVQLQSGEAYRRLDERLQRVFESETVAVTIVSLEEQTRGWLGYLNKASAKRDDSDLINGYDRLHELVKDYSARTILDFDEASHARYRELRGKYKRCATLDLRIAAIVLTHRATLLTRNVRDFERVEGLKFEDWTRD